MMGTEQYCLKWNNHWANLVRVFNSLLQSETFVDVTLACEGRHVKAHRLVLSACSPYFKGLLLSHPDNHPIVILKDVRFSELQSLIRFMYNGEVSVEQDALPSLLCTAKELQIRGLADNNIFNSIPNIPQMITGVDYGTKVPLNSTNTSSIRLPSKPNDEPTNLTVRNRNASLSPHSGKVSPGGERTFQQQQQEGRAVSPTGVSPVSKKRKASCLVEDESTDVSDMSPSQENGTVPWKYNDVEDSSRSANDAAGPSGVSPHTQMEGGEKPPESVSIKDKKESSPARPILKELKDKPPDITISELPGKDKEGYEEGPLDLQAPEITSEDLKIAKTNGTSSPSPPIPNTDGKSSLMTDSSTSTSLPSPPISLLQQAMAMNYPQPIPFLPSGILDQQQAKPGLQNLPTSPGLVHVKSILNFVDILKAIGAGMPAASQANLLSSLGNSGLSIGLQSMSPLGSGTSAVGSSKSPMKDQDLNPLTCHICARIMPSIQVLEEHVRIHEEEKPYKCDQCGQRYKYQSAFQRHQEQNHTAKLPGDKPYRCDVCGQCFKYHKSFTKHRSNHDLIDNFMKEEPDDKSAIRAFQESYLQTLLHQPYTQSEAFQGSIKEEIKDPSECDPSDTPDNLDEGNQDSKGANDPLALTTKTFTPENGEIKEEEDDIDIDEIVPDVPDEGEEEQEEGGAGKFFYCLHCKSTFKDSKSFEGHCRLSPGCSLETLKEVSVGGEVSVTSIPSSSGSSAHGSPHTSTAEDPSTSTQNSTPISTSFVLSASPNIVCTLVGGLPTTTCYSNTCAPTILNFSKFVNVSGSTSTAISDRLRTRASDQHSVLSLGNNGNVGSSSLEEERPFKCPYCQKGFKGRENLKLHIRTHTGEKPYNCGVCGKAFGGRSDMNRHLRIHTGEKPYPCKVCGKKFARADYLSKHITTHLGIPFAKPVHSLQQSLQNLENMQNLHNVQILPSVQNIQPVQIIPGVQNMQPVQIIPNVQNLQSTQATTKE